MPECENCESQVTKQYVRVFEPQGVENPRVCPFCEDMVRDGSDVREARADRRGNGSEPVRYDPEIGGRA